MSTLSVTIRAATQDELERFSIEDKANLIDGSFAVLRDGELIGLTDEYGTALYHQSGLTQESIEAIVEAVQKVFC